MEEAVPQVQMESLVCPTEDGNKVVPEGRDGLLGNVASVVVRRDQLELRYIVSDDNFQVCQAFIVEDVQLGEDACRIQTVMSA
jgi:hypothetical protein